MIYRFLMIILCLFINVAFGNDKPLVQQTKQFVSLSDIHFDPMFGCERYKSPCPILKELIASDYKNWETIFEKYNDKSIKYYRDTNYALFTSLLRQLKYISEQSQPEFVLILGDFLDHKLQKNFKKFSLDKSDVRYASFVKKTMQFMTYKLNQIFPTTDIYPVLGNVDLYGKDYKVAPNGIFLQDMTTLWSTFIKNKTNQHYFLKEFSKGGYYSVDISETTKIVILDTVLFSPRSQNTIVKQAALQQLNWLRNQLEDAQQHHKMVLIACHIPMGIDIYLSSSVPYKIIKNFWRADYTTSFLKILQDYSDCIVGMLPGHVHVDLFQFTIKGKNNTIIPLIFTPSVSPIFGNNPAIKVFNYQNASLSLQSFERYYRPLSKSSTEWRKGNRFNGIYQTKCQSCYLSSLIQHLVVNNYLLNIVTKYYAQSMGIESDETSRLSYYWCSIYSNDMTAYKNCINE